MEGNGKEVKGKLKGHLSVFSIFDSFILFNGLAVSI